MQDSSHAAQRRVIGGIQNHGIICFPGKEDKKWAHYGQKLPEDETFGFRGAPFYSLGAQAKQENIVNASARQFVSFVRYKLTPNAPHLIWGVNFLLIHITFVITKTYFYYFLLLLIIIAFIFLWFFFGCNSRCFGP